MTEQLTVVQADLMRQDLTTQIADAAERVKIQAAIADRAMQSLVIVQGGGLVALFTFVGNLSGRPGAPSFDTIGLKAAFACFALGLAAILMAHLFAFASQDRFYTTAMLEARRLEQSILSGSTILDQSDAFTAHRVGYRYFGVGLILFTLSVALFLGGCGSALFSFL